MSFQLVPLIKGTAPIIALHRPVLLIGRHLECDARLDSPKISRRHCCVAIAYDRVVIRDLGSRNQVRVNGQVVEEARLQSGDEIAIGPLLYRLDPIEERRTGPASRPDRPTSVLTTPANALTPGGSSSAARNPFFPGPDPESQLIPLDDL
jgi:pSer/pThr/pTyr-binding forkhead associated (FHA) protein